MLAVKPEMISVYKRTLFSLQDFFMHLPSHLEQIINMRNSEERNMTQMSTQQTHTNVSFLIYFTDKVKYTTCSNN